MSRQHMIVTMIWLILAALCFIYGMLVRAIGSGTGFYKVWLGLGVVFLLFALSVRVELWQKLPMAVKVIFLAIVCIGLASFVVVEANIVKDFQQKGRAGLDYVIVLGAQVYSDGPSVVLQYRLDAAAEYLKDNPETICIVSGGKGSNEVAPEAEIMAEYLETKGIDGDRILQEDQSKTTEENMENSKALIPEGATVGIITNNFHLHRALQLAERADIENVSGIAAGSTPLYLPNNMLREYFGEVKFLIGQF